MRSAEITSGSERASVAGLRVLGDDAKVEIHNKTTVDRNGDDHTTETRKELNGTLGTPLLSVHAVKGLDRACGPRW